MEGLVGYSLVMGVDDVASKTSVVGLNIVMNVVIVFCLTIFV